MVQNMKKYVSILGDDGVENGSKAVCCFCKKELKDEFFVDDTGRTFCHRLCRQRRIEALKKHALRRTL